MVGEEPGGDSLTRLDVGLFAPNRPILHREAEEALRSELDWYLDCWPGIEVVVRHYVTPLRGDENIYFMGEVQDPIVGETFTIMAGSTSADPGHAATILVAELHERSSFAWYRPPTYRHASAWQLQSAGERVFDVEKYVGMPLFPERWPYAQYDTLAARTWVPGFELGTGSTVYVPLTLVSPRCDVGERVSDLTTIGCAAHTDREVSLGSATEELIERDGLKRAWMREAVPEPIDVNDDSQDFGEWTTQWFSIPVEPPHHLVVAYTRSKECPLFAIGSALSDDVPSAISHAAREVRQGRLSSWLYRNHRLDLQDADSFFDRMHYYSRPDRIGVLDEFFGLGPAGVSDNAALLEQAGQHEVQTPNQDPTARCSERVAVDLLSSNGRYVTRVVRADLQPLEGKHRFARITGTMRGGDGLVKNYRPHPFG